MILKIEVSLKLVPLPGAVKKQQPSDPCLHARMPDVSYLCVMSESWTLYGDDELIMTAKFTERQMEFTNLFC